MERHFHEQLQHLKDTLIEMAEQVENAIAEAIEALVNQNADLANKVVKKDININMLEIRIDNECLKLLATQQPMAVDLRFVTSAMKINNDLERMGDHAVNIAERAAMLCSQNHLIPLRNIPKMAEITQSMVRDSLNSFVTEDVKKAREVCQRDDKVDQLDDSLFRKLLSEMMKDTQNIPKAINYLLISKNLERIADLSTNISEEVIFIYKAKSIKHHLNPAEVIDIRSKS